MEARRSSATSRRQSTIGQSSLGSAISRIVRKKSDIEIVLDGGNEFVKTYGTFDTIKGHISFKLEKDTLIDALSITFEGQAQTFVEKIATASPTTGRTTGRHTFLRLQQPVTERQLPTNMLAIADQTYNIPFHFVVPNQLLPYICCHKIAHAEVKDEHMKLPPSIGDPLQSGFGNTLMDDLAPEMAKIVYMIKVKLQRGVSSNGRGGDIDEKTLRVRVAPNREELPPLHMEPNDFFVLKKEKNIKGGFLNLGRKQGKLAAGTDEPKPVALPPISVGVRSPIMTMATVRLRFDPSSATQRPPHLSNLATSLKVFTFYGATSFKNLPTLSKFDNWSALHGVYPETIRLSSRCVEGVSWKRHEPSDVTSCGSDGSQSSRQDINGFDRSDADTTDNGTSPTSSRTGQILPCYTARLIVPVTLPMETCSTEQTVPASNALRRASTSANEAQVNKSGRRMIFVPTFHSCIISRLYALELGLTFSPIDAKGNTSYKLSTSSITLRAPLQITQAGRDAPDPVGAEIENAISVVPEGFDSATELEQDGRITSDNPSGLSMMSEVIPEYEEMRTGFSSGVPRHQSMTDVLVSGDYTSLPARLGQPPEYSSRGGSRRQEEQEFMRPYPSMRAVQRRHSVTTEYGATWSPLAFLPGR